MTNEKIWTVEALVEAMRATGKPGITGPFDALFGEDTPARRAARGAFCDTIGRGPTYTINGGTSAPSEAELLAVCAALNKLGGTTPMAAPGGGDWSRARVLERLKAVGEVLPQAGIYGLFAAAFGDHGKAACEAWRASPGRGERHVLAENRVASVCDNELDAVARDLTAAAAPLAPPPPSAAALRAFVETYASGVTAVAFLRHHAGPHAADAFTGGWAGLETYLAGRLSGIAPRAGAPAPEAPPAPKADPYETHAIASLDRAAWEVPRFRHSYARSRSRAEALISARERLAAALVARAETQLAIASLERAIAEHGGPEGEKGSGDA